MEARHEFTAPFASKTRTFPTRLDTLEAKHGKIWVVRDDLLPGGTKQRASVPFLEDQKARGVESVVYASPFAGFAQVALSLSARVVGVRSRIYCEEDKTSLLPGCPHPFSHLAEKAGAEIVVVKTLVDAEREAEAYAKSTRSLKIPLGFACPEFTAHLESAVRRCWGEILAQARTPPRRLWLPVGSGTLANCFRKVLPEGVELRLVDVGVLAPEDPRISRLAGLPNTSLVRAPESFHQRAETSPPIPSNIHYDAKLWRFVLDHAETGDVWWNVAQ